MIGTQPEVLLAGEPVRVLASTQAGEVVGVLPDSPRGVADLTLRNSLGKHTVQVVIEDVAPVFLRTEAGNTAVVQSDKGLFTLYLTGLGHVREQGSFLVHVTRPEVTIGGRRCEVVYSGRSGMPGVDQINCIVGESLAAGPANVLVRTAERSASGSVVVQ
jgi:uncharacterized protein (TIGR03437 family)